MTRSALDRQRQRRFEAAQQVQKNHPEPLVSNSSPTRPKIFSRPFSKPTQHTTTEGQTVALVDEPNTEITDRDPEAVERTGTAVLAPASTSIQHIEDDLVKDSPVPIDTADAAGPAVEGGGTRTAIGLQGDIPDLQLPDPFVTQPAAENSAPGPGTWNGGERGQEGRKRRKRSCCRIM